jgi:hypothetical protein
MDQATGDMKTESKKPENKQDHDNRPKHVRPLSASWAPEFQVSPGCSRALLNPTTSRR